jgi:hypothetical protein
MHDGDVSAYMRCQSSAHGDHDMRTTTIATALAVVTLMTGFGVSSALAQGDICSQLWVARNSIYKAAGYCFKTQRAISYFGNAGCMYDVEAALPLAPGERARINAIVAQERMNGCR